MYGVFIIGMLIVNTLKSLVAFALFAFLGRGRLNFAISLWEHISRVLPLSSSLYEDLDGILLVDLIISNVSVVLVEITIFPFVFPEIWCCCFREFDSNFLNLAYAYSKRILFLETTSGV